MTTSPEGLFKLYPNKYFVETGSYYGLGIERALEAGFEKVISIELGQKYYDICKNKFANDPRVQVIFGDAALVLGDAIKDINENITFWLDGHFCGEDTASGIVPDPIIEELTTILQHPIKTHTIIIDNLNCMGHLLPNVYKLLKEINPNYKLPHHDTQYGKQSIVAANP